MDGVRRNRVTFRFVRSTICFLTSWETLMIMGGEGCWTVGVMEMMAGCGVTTAGTTESSAGCSATAAVVIIIGCKVLKEFAAGGGG